MLCATKSFLVLSEFQVYCAVAFICPHSMIMNNGSRCENNSFCLCRISITLVAGNTVLLAAV